jgi:outer membrane immunogenic protein
LDSRWSAKIEYLYISLSESRFSITGMSNGYNASVVRAGVNYHF